MKTLNRTLSLVLVLVMVLGIFGIAGAANFTDASDVTYTEAIDVMVGIGVIDGYTDGSIKPTATVTREEAAKMIAYAVLGKDVAENLSTGETGFTDVAANRWSAPYIAYLVGAGIINGMGDGTFAPTDNVTGYQFAKMMLCAAGYGAKNEYTGSSWELNVAVDANKNGVFDDAVGVNFTAAATREEAMLYAFNGIQVNQVEYNELFNSYVGKGQGITSAKGPSIMAEVYKTMAYAGPYTYNSNGVKTGFNGEDAFGRPADVWTYKNKAIGAYAIGENFFYSSSKASPSGVAAVEKELKGYGIKTGGADLYVNGNLSAPVSSLAGIAAQTGNGTEVFVYIINNVIHRVVAVNTVLAKVALVDSKAENITLIPLAAAAGYGFGGGTAIKTDVGYGKVSLGDYVVIGTIDTDGNGSISGDTAIGYLAPVTKVEGKATAMSTTDSTITVDGTVYKQAKGVANGYAVADFEVTGDSNATLLLDAHGFFLQAVPGDTISADRMIAVTKNVNTLAENNEIVPTVVGFNSKGETISLPCAAYGVATPGAVVEYTKGADGLYTFTATTANNAVAQGYTQAGMHTKADKTVTLGGALGSMYFSSDVKVIFAAAAPAIATNAVVANGMQIIHDGSDANVAKITYVYRQVGSLNEVFALFVEDAPIAAANAASELVFLADTGGKVVGKDGKSYDSFTAIKGGMPIENCYGDASGLTEGMFYIATVSETTGAYTLTRYSDAQGLKTTNGTSPFSSFPTNIAVSAINTAATNITGGFGSVDISKAILINLDTESLGSGAEMSATLTSIKLGQKPGKFLAAFVIYDNTTGAASHVYYAVKDVVGTVANATGLVENGTTLDITSDVATAKYGDVITYTVSTTAGTATAAGTYTFSAPLGTTFVGGTANTKTVAIGDSVSTTYQVKVTSTTPSIAAPTVSFE